MPTAYLDSEQNSKNDTKWTNSILMSSLNGIEGIPYQFMDNVDERINKNKSKKTKIGRKYGEKIISRMPLLFLTPCEPRFIDTNASDRRVMFGALMGSENRDLDFGLEDLLSDESNGVRYYTSQFALSDYYMYLNLMLNNIADYMGLGDVEIPINGKPTKLREVAWQDELSVNFSNYFYAKASGQLNSLFFYCDSIDSVSESFTNDTTQSSIANQINGTSDSMKEVQFLLGGDSGGLAGSVAESFRNALDGSESDKSWLEDIFSGTLDTLLGMTTGENSWLTKMKNSGAFAAVAAGGKIIFPEIWSDSSYSKSYSLDIKLRSPDHDSLSIYLNIIKPYCKLLALTMPRAFKNWESNQVDPNGYGSPFLVKAACKGVFNIDMGLITGLSVTKGASCAWNDDGLPTQIDITLDIKDLYSTLAMSGYPSLPINPFSTFEQLMDTTKNAAYNDFLANMAGLNVNEMLPFRNLKTKFYNISSYINQIPSSLFTRFDQSVANLVGKMNWLK